MSSVAARLQKLGITLPAPVAAVANYVPYVLQGDILVISGQLPIENGEKKFFGRLGENVSLEDGKKAARICAVNLIAQSLSGGLRAAEAGSAKAGGSDAMSTPVADPAIAQIMADQSTSDWLKTALRAALERDPVDALNDTLALAGVLEERLRQVMGLHDPV